MCNRRRSCSSYGRLAQAPVRLTKLEPEPEPELDVQTSRSHAVWKPEAFLAPAGPIPRPEAYTRAHLGNSWAESPSWSCGGSNKRE
ncbi:hypothetical protein S40285_10544 [Stachybotrys chlorohalonatus IBT 40285]|uniref:Uncharacterized protein n=1 Tax=Stachybotrys chlorohalonatus (strain IBT 40285) TaxID=1283841 RepID=A0A084QDD6_STAC4|nr:hypothetical protein S40285_10544 [Stachybotrys chlorohalonata IBT 40285]